VAYHRACGELPGCFFTKEGERTYDRSLRALMKDRCVSPEPR
jgi:polyribonucleotide nucleotidyltransferase